MNNFDTLIKEGLDLASQERYPAALEKFAEACRLRPDSASAWSNRAGILYLQGNIADAEASYREAIRCDPGLPEANYGLIRCLLSRRALTSAREVLETLDSSERVSPEWIYYSGILDQLEGHNERADEQFRQAAGRGYQPAQKALLRLLIAANQPVDLAKQLCSDAKQRDESLPDPLLLLSAQKALPNARSRWEFAGILFREFPGVPLLYDVIAGGFLHMNEFAYAARTAAEAARTIPDISLNDWPSLKECAWF